jgi:3-isopropylmalate/(R)-2-methylmalate dehydratase small subunit
MVLKGRVWRLGDNVSTDHIIPGRFYHLRSNLDELKNYTFQDIIPCFAKKVSKGDVVVAGKNFGLGSSREHAAIVLKVLGISAVVAPSFARIFYRNAINIGLPAIICEVEGIEQGDNLEIRLGDGIIVDENRGIERRFSPFPSIMRDILREGGLEAYIRKYGDLKV